MGKKTLSRILIYLPPLLYAAMIFFLSSRSFEFVHVDRGMDKGIHLLIYTGLGYLLLRSFRKAGFRGKVGLLTLVIVFFYGLSDEIHQYFVPGRVFDLMDLVFDFLGGVIAVAFCGLADRLKWPIWF